MPLVLRYEKAAAKALRRLPKHDRDALVEKLEAIAADPQGQHPYVVPLKREHGAFRCEHGSWRALYRIDKQTSTMSVFVVGHRREVYDL